jgi:hypothetical protein
MTSIISCEPNELTPDTNKDNKNPTTTQPLNKRGVAYTNTNKTWSYKTSEQAAHWMYSWGLDLRDEIPKNVEFVPMFWGKSSVSDANIAKVKQYIASGKVKYVLGFNEPDGKEQANMTVDEAIALWPKLQELGVPIGSPATTHPTNEWMKDFMKKAGEKGLRVDFIAVHSYPGANAGGLIALLKQTYEEYGKKPIWITEFAVADWSAKTPEENKVTVTKAQEFMQEILPALDALPYIQRYAWFDAGQNNPALHTSSLYDKNNKITALGSFYSRANPNSSIGQGQDTEFVPPIDVDELIPNNGFETGTLLPEWGGYNNAISNVNFRTGKFGGAVKTTDGSLINNAVVVPGKTYTLKFWSRWSDVGPNVLAPTFRNGESNALLTAMTSVPTSIEWKETTVEYVVPAGITKLRLQFYKLATPNIQFYLDDVTFKEKK